MNETEIKSKKQNISLSRAMLILEAMVKYRKPVRLLDIAKDTGLTSSTVYRFLNAFIECGYVKRNEDFQTYSLTLKLAEIGHLCMQNYQLTDNMHIFLEEISTRFHESAALCVENNMQIVYVDISKETNRLLSSNIQIGKVAPMHCTAEGKIFLSEYSDEKLRIFVELKGLQRFTPNTICDIANLKKELEVIRLNGYAWSREEHEIGTKTLSVPIKSYTDQVIATISLTSPIQRFPQESDAIDFMKELAKKASMSLGFRIQ